MGSSHTKDKKILTTRITSFISCSSCRDSDGRYFKLRPSNKKIEICFRLDINNVYHLRLYKNIELGNKHRYQITYTQSGYVIDIEHAKPISLRTRIFDIIPIKYGSNSEFCKRYNEVILYECVRIYNEYIRLVIEKERVSSISTDKIYKLEAETVAPFKCNTYLIRNISIVE